MAKTPGSPTQQLPKATVQLAKGTGPMAGGGAGARGAVTPPSAPVKRPQQADNTPLYEETDPEAGLAPLAILCTVFAVGVMCLNLLGSDSAFAAAAGESSAIMVPAADNPYWEVRDTTTGTYKNQFTTELKKITDLYNE
jgi:hypothetical protein